MRVLPHTHSKIRCAQQTTTYGPYSRHEFVCSLVVRNEMIDFIAKCSGRLLSTNVKFNLVRLVNSFRTRVLLLSSGRRRIVEDH